MNLNNFKAELIDFFIEQFPKLYTEMYNSHHGVDLLSTNKYHVEGSVLTHTMMVLQNAQTELGSICALLHDIGKPACRYVKKDTSRTIFGNHEGYGFFMLDEILNVFKERFEPLKVSDEDILNIKLAVALHGSFRKLELNQFIERTHGLTDNQLELLDELLEADSNGRFCYDSGIWEHNIEDVLFNGYRESIKSLHEDVMSRKTKEVVFLIGLPGSGKSTYLKEHYSNYEVLSKDDLIMEYGKGNSYDDKYGYFKSSKKREQELNVLFDKRMNELLQGENNVVVDMTNLFKSLRTKKANKFRNRGFKLKAVVFSNGINSCYDNSKKRNGKTISKDIIDNMAKKFEFPTYKEFHEIVIC